MAAQRNMFAMLADENDETSSTSQQQTDDDALTVYTPLTDTHPSDDADDAEAPQDGILSPEAIQARAEATRHKQMRAFLLGFHKNYHGPEEPLGNGIWGAVVQPRGRHAVPEPDNPIEDDTSFRSNIIPVPGSTASYENPDNVWLTPELPAKLGFPIKVTTWPFPYGRGGDLHKYNYFVHTLFTGADSSTSNFAKFTREAYTGEALIVRTDGKDMSDQQLEVLLHFINDEFSVAAVQLLDMEEGKEKDKVKKGIAEKYLNPEALHAYWQEYRREMITNGRIWEAAVSPVKVTVGEVKPACGRCFSRKAKEKQFLFCEGCEDRFYCSKVCSDRDEKRHSRVCFMDDKNADSGLDSGDSADTQSSGACHSDDNV